MFDYLMPNSCFKWYSLYRDNHMTNALPAILFRNLMLLRNLSKFSSILSFFRNIGVCPALLRQIAILKVVLMIFNYNVYTKAS